MVVANIFDFIDGKVAHELKAVSAFGGFWDSVIDRFSDLALFLGLIFLYSTLGRTDYVMITALAMMFAIMTSYTRARADRSSRSARSASWSGPSASCSS